MRYLLVCKIILFTVLIPGSVIVYIPYLIVKGSYQTNLLLPASLFMLSGIAIYLRCAYDFAVEGLGTPAPVDPPKKLVVTGLYRWNRNPMYLGMLLVLLSECLMFLKADLLLYTAVVAIIFNIFVVFYEEPLLLEKFAEPYTDYCNKVPRWFIALKPYFKNSD
jgi:protein-S-isoprenylcysteine O-methyltransferase Ste14